MTVRTIFENAGYQIVRISLGEVETLNYINSNVMENVRNALDSYDFEHIDDSKSRIIEKIKNTIVQLVHHNNEDLKVNYFVQIESTLNKDYTYLSGLFSKIEGATIEKYIIIRRYQ